MKLSIMSRVVLVGVLLAACAGQTPTDSPAPTAAPTSAAVPQAEQQPLIEQALGFVPAGYASSIYFTDWTLIKAYEGTSNLTSQSPWSERRELFLALRQYNLVAYAVGTTQQHAPAWGWDFTDLEWEAMISLDEYLLPGATRAGSKSAYVLKLRDGMDLAPIVAHFTEYGFTAQSYNGVDIYSNKPDRTAAWFNMANPAVLNTAILPDQNVLILSEHLPVVQTIVDTLSGKEPNLANANDLGPTLAALDDPATAFIAGGIPCKDWNPLLWKGAINPLRDLSTEQKDELKQLLGDSSSLHAYGSFGMGYRAENSVPTNTLVLQYSSSSDAEADLATRQRIITEGFGRTGDPYFMDVALSSATREDTALIFVLGSPGGSDGMSGLFMRNDMLFAACP